MNAYVATKANMQLRMEAGYQFTTKPIFLINKAINNYHIKTKSSGKSSCGSYYYRSNCSRSYSSRSSHCQSKNTAAKKAENKNKGGWFVCNHLWV
jgi:hypothetical protein